FWFVGPVNTRSVALGAGELPGQRAAPSSRSPAQPPSLSIPPPRKNPPSLAGRSLYPLSLPQRHRTRRPTAGLRRNTGPLGAQPDGGEANMTTVRADLSSAGTVFRDESFDSASIISADDDEPLSKIITPSYKQALQQFGAPTGLPLTREDSAEFRAPGPWPRSAAAVPALSPAAAACTYTSSLAEAKWRTEALGAAFLRETADVAGEADARRSAGDEPPPTTPPPPSTSSSFASPGAGPTSPAAAQQTERRGPPTPHSRERSPLRLTFEPIALGGPGGDRSVEEPRRVHRHTMASRDIKDRPWRALHRQVSDKGPTSRYPAVPAVQTRKSLLQNSVLMRRSRSDGSLEKLRKSTGTSGKTGNDWTSWLYRGRGRLSGAFSLQRQTPFPRNSCSQQSLAGSFSAAAVVNGGTSGVGDSANVATPPPEGPLFPNEEQPAGSASRSGGLAQFALLSSNLARNEVQLNGGYELGGPPCRSFAGANDRFSELPQSNLTLFMPLRRNPDCGTKSVPTDLTDPKGAFWADPHVPGGSRFGRAPPPTPVVPTAGTFKFSADSAPPDVIEEEEPESALSKSAVFGVAGDLLARTARLRDEPPSAAATLRRKSFADGLNPVESVESLAELSRAGSGRSVRDPNSAQEEILRNCVAEFNINPTKGLQQLIACKLVENDRKAVANLLFTEPRLDKTSLGEYLGIGDPFNIAVLGEFVGLLDFTGQDFDTALRKLLTKFRLPGEAQKIDRIMNNFAIQFCKNNPGVFNSL
ncbi:MAG: hypothetical protein BJ554DRAFT_7389, partial [Olpidium bornovanus]